MAARRVRGRRPHAGGGEHRRAAPPRRRLPAAAEFAPERFLHRKPGTYTWIPFGGGIRRCLGATLAMAEQRVVLDAIARRTDLARRTPRPRRRAMRNVTMIPGRGGRVVVTTRRQRWPRRVVSERVSPSPAGAADRRDGGLDRARGYRDTTVADVVRLARTSRRNFYEHFVDRDACFLALFDATNDAMMDEIAATVDPVAVARRAGRRGGRHLHLERDRPASAVPQLRP